MNLIQEIGKRNVSAKERRQQIVKTLRTLGNITLDDFSKVFNVASNEVSGRFTELKNSGVIKPTGFKRNTRAGKKAVIYTLV